MEVPITQFRREIFALCNQALDGGEVWVTHRGRRFRIVPEGPPASRLGRIAPMEIVNPEAPDLNEPVLEDETKIEMKKAWESDWFIL
jgi:antitoxin (DNA-binding transcriptional repressor) of toxin-antitoxin stability system